MLGHANQVQITSCSLLNRGQYYNEYNVICCGKVKNLLGKIALKTVPYNKDINDKYKGLI